MLTRRYHGLARRRLRPAGRAHGAGLEDSTRPFLSRGTYASSARSAGTTTRRAARLARHRALSISTAALPVWHYAFADALLEKRIWMEHGDEHDVRTYRALRARRRAGRVDAARFRRLPRLSRATRMPATGAPRSMPYGTAVASRSTRTRRAPVLDRRERRNRRDTKTTGISTT